MANVFLLAPVQSHVGLTTICLGLLRALDGAGLRAAFFKPIAQPHRAGGTGPAAPQTDRSIHFARDHLGLDVIDPLDQHHALSRLADDQLQLLMEEVLERFHSVEQDVDVVIVEGLIDTENEDVAQQINSELAANLNAEVILVAAPRQLNDAALDHLLRLAMRPFDSPDDPDVIACILNKVGAGQDPEDRVADEGDSIEQNPEEGHARNAVPRRLLDGKIHTLAEVPWRPEFIAPRVSDIVTPLAAEVLNAGEIGQRRVIRISVCARTLPNMLGSLSSGTLVVTPGDREDVLVAAGMAALIGVPLAGILLTGGLQPDPRTLKLCMPAMDTGLPILTTRGDTYHTANFLSRLDPEVPEDDHERIEEVISNVAASIDIEWLRQRIKTERPLRLSPAAFRYQLARRAREADRTIVLPEGNEPRTVKAAIICHERELARCILLGERAEIQSVAEAQGMTLPDDLQITDPEAVRADYVADMVELRKHKGLTPQMAEAQLEDNVVLGTMMLARGEVDGLVSGAVHTTANTVRPAFQLIKARPGSRIVSSVFFMLLPEQVVVYGDCAINPDPDANELADIALQCADSAALFGIEPKVAMLSYSTGSSGTGADVDKVREATRMARESRPDLLIDGPLQYDAAVMRDVAAKKAPDSPVAGRATVFVFPDLNTGNTTYKAVQRSANVVSVGPMLQGLKKPVNDLSRGALVEDIVFTIALTAIQATQVDSGDLTQED